MMWLVENWMVVVGILAVVCGVGVAVYRFFGLPTAQQVAAMKEWLLFACVEAEKALGSGTGQLKLRYVWDLFLGKFPTAARLVSFEVFSLWVDGALEEMRQMLTQNKAVREVVKGESLE